MATLDVIDAILSPEFMDYGLICHRNTQTIDDNGIAHDYVEQITFNGVVTTRNGNLLFRVQTGEHLTGQITVTTPMILSDGTTSDRSADIVEWQGMKYTVVAVKDWRHFGRGFCSATCERISVRGGPDG